MSSFCPTWLNSRRLNSSFFFHICPAYDDSISKAIIPPTVDRQTKESSHPPGRHRVKPGKELLTTDRPDSIAPVTPQRPRAADNLTLTTGIHPISSSKLYSHVLNPGTLLYATYFDTTYSLLKELLLSNRVFSASTWQDPIGKIRSI
jgi:hypothetical protein